LVHINNQEQGHKKVQHPLIYYYTSAIVTSTSTPGSMVMDVICFTTSEGLCRSITRLCTRNSNLSHVLVPKHKQHNIINVIHQKAKWKSWVFVLGAKNSTNKEKMKPHMWIKDVTCADIAVQIKEQPSASTTTASSVEQNSSVCNHKKKSQLLLPSPQGDLRVVMCNTLVGIRTGPFTFNRLSLAPLIKSAHTVIGSREESIDHVLYSEKLVVTTTQFNPEIYLSQVFFLLK
jgi:hypothetical protein